MSGGLCGGGQEGHRKAMWRKSTAIRERSEDWKKKDKKPKRYRLKTAARERKKKDESTIDDSTSMEIRRGGSGDELCLVS
jgi:hypothetical protein